MEILPDFSVWGFFVLMCALGVVGDNVFRGTRLLDGFDLFAEVLYYMYEIFVTVFVHPDASLLSRLMCVQAHNRLLGISKALLLCCINFIAAWAGLTSAAAAVGCSHGENPRVHPPLSHSNR
jgi:hypothetical protein